MVEELVMGIFSRKPPESPWSQVYRVSQGRFMPAVLKGEGGILLLTASLSSTTGDNPSQTLSLDEEAIKKFGTDNLIKFFKLFFNTYNNTFGNQESSEPPAWEEFALEQYPNYGMLTELKEFRIEEQWIYHPSSWRPEFVKNHSEKIFTLVLAMDSKQIGKLFFPMLIDGKTHFETFFDFQVDLTSDFGFTQWSMCSSDDTIKTALLAKVKFMKNSKFPYEISFKLTSNPVEYSLILEKLGWKN